MIAWRNIFNFRAHLTDSCIITVCSVPFRGLCTLPREASFSFKKTIIDLLTGFVQILVHNN